MDAAMKSGWIFLYHRDGEVAASNSYYNKPERDKIIDGWKRRYAAAYKNTYLQICPDVDSTLIDVNGENLLPRKRTRKKAIGKLLTI